MDCIFIYKQINNKKAKNTCLYSKFLLRKNKIKDITETDIISPLREITSICVGKIERKTKRIIRALNVENRESFKFTNKAKLIIKKQKNERHLTIISS